MKFASKLIDEGPLHLCHKHLLLPSGLGREQVHRATCVGALKLRNKFGANNKVVLCTGLTNIKADAGLGSQARGTLYNQKRAFRFTPCFLSSCRFKNETCRFRILKNTNFNFKKIFLSHM